MNHQATSTEKLYLGNTVIAENDSGGIPWIKGSMSPGVRLASQFGGMNLGQKINSAIASLGGGAGEIWVDQSAGSAISTTVTATHTGQVIRFLQGGVYTIGATMNIAHMIGSGFGAPHWQGDAPVILRQGAGANLSKMINIIFDAGSITSLQIDGLGASNASALDNVYSEKRGIMISDCYITLAKRHGVYITSATVLGNSAAVPKMRGSVIYQNGGSGVVFENLSDPWIVGHCEFEDNTLYGIDLRDAPGARIFASDFAQNREAALFMHGTTGRFGSSMANIVGNQFGQNYKQDIFIGGHDGGGYVCLANNIVSNQFHSGSFRANNTDAAVVELNSRANIISGNVFRQNGNTYSWGIQAIETGGLSGVSYWGPNAYEGSFGSGEKSPISAKTRLLDGTAAP